MKVSMLVAAAALAFASASVAEPVSGPRSGDVDARVGCGFGATGTLAAAATACPVASPAQCEPDSAAPVWGPNGDLRGFSCFRNEGGGQ